MIIIYLQETTEDEATSPYHAIDQLTIERLKKAAEKAREETRQNEKDHQPIRADGLPALGGYD